MEQQAKATLLDQRKVLEQNKNTSVSSNGAGSGYGGAGGGSVGGNTPPANERTDGSSSALLVGGVIAAGAVLALGLFAGGDKVKEVAADETARSSAAKSTGTCLLPALLPSHRYSTHYDEYKHRETTSCGLQLSHLC